MQTPISPTRRRISPSDSRRTSSRQRVTLIPNQASSPQYRPRQEATSTPLPTKRLNTGVKTRSKSRPPKLLTSLFIYVLRLLIMGVGIGAIAGTALTLFHPKGAISFNSQPSEAKASSKSSQQTTPAAVIAPPVSLSHQLTSLEQKLTALAAKNPKLEAEAFFIDLDNGAYVNIKGDAPIAAASTIKIPVLVAFFQDVDAGKIHLDELLTMKKELITSGSGTMQYQQVGKKFTALETATQMIVISDNTATSMLIERLGGKAALNQRFQQWGLSGTIINNVLPDLEGTNTTSPRDLANLLIRVHRGELVSMKSRDRLLEIMSKTKNRSLLPQGLEKEAMISHKTGDIGTVLGDAGIIDMPNGKRYIGAVFVKRPHNDYSGTVLIQEISRTAYQHFKWYQARPATTATKPQTSIP